VAPLTEVGECGLHVEVPAALEVGILGEGAHQGVDKPSTPPHPIPTPSDHHGRNLVPPMQMLSLKVLGEAVRVGQAEVLLLQRLVRQVQQLRLEGQGRPQRVGICGLASPAG
jgi:hypothetical protein